MRRDLPWVFKFIWLRRIGKLSPGFLTFWSQNALRYVRQRNACLIWNSPNLTMRLWHNRARYDDSIRKCQGAVLSWSDACSHVLNKLDVNIQLDSPLMDLANWGPQAKICMRLSLCSTTQTNRHDGTKKRIRFQVTCKNAKRISTVIYFSLRSNQYQYNQQDKGNPPQTVTYLAKHHKQPYT